MPQGVNHHLDYTFSCICSSSLKENLIYKDELGMDEVYADVSILVCSNCGQYWLKYLYELEAFTASGRWYLGAITSEQAEDLRPQDAKSLLEGLRWYYYGGSFYFGKIRRSSGPILL